MISSNSIESRTMGWGVSREQQGWRKGPWTPEEDKLLSDYINLHGDGRWSSVAKCSARYLPGRTDNEIKNYWRTHFKTKPKLSQNQEKRKNEALNQKQHDQQSKIGTNNVEIELPLAEVNDDGKMGETQGKQETVFTHPTMEQPCWPMTNQDVLESWSDMMMDDDLWGSLWNAEELNYCRQMGHTGTQNQGIAYSCGGADTNNWYTGGNIF
ncbi:hypothetical protein LguiA_006265 [Lonicera macranthoides]